MARLSEEQIEQNLASSEWRRDGEAIAREWQLPDFGQAMEFVNRVADAAEAANHHPDIHLHGWNKVRLELFTHSEGGLTQSDFDMARRIDELA